MEKRRLVVIAVLLMISVVNYTRIVGGENIRAVQFLSIFAIGILSGFLIQGVVKALRK
jgi:hypothetical protein